MIGTKERGKFKQQIKNMLYKNINLKEAVIMQPLNGLDEKVIINEFNKVVKSHLFIDNTLTEKGTYIFFDVVCPEILTQTKECKIVLYAVCHRDLLDDYKKDGYYGNRVDVLSQIIEETLLDDENAKQFGIGSLALQGVEIYNSKEYYGVQMIFNAECFR